MIESFKAQEYTIEHRNETFFNSDLHEISIYDDIGALLVHRWCGKKENCPTCTSSLEEVLKKVVSSFLKSNR